jgi:hypothetical protein
VIVAAVATAGTDKAVGKNAAFKVLDKRFAHKGLGAVMVALAGKLACAGQLNPGLIALGHSLVQQRALRVALVVELGFGGVWHNHCANTNCARTQNQSRAYINDNQIVITGSAISVS